MRNFVFGAAAVVAIAGSASAVNLASFSFELTVPASAGPHAADGSGVYSASSTIRGSHVSGSTTYDNPVGNGSAESFSSNNWAVGDFYEVRTSSLSYDTITVSWDQAASNTGPRDFSLSYSLNGSSFVTVVPSYAVLANASPNMPWSGGVYRPEYTFDFALPAGAANATDLYIRLTDISTISAAGGTVAGTGTNRIDNVVVGGTLVPTPGALALLGSAGLVGLRRRRA